MMKLGSFNYQPLGQCSSSTDGFLKFVDEILLQCTLRCYPSHEANCAGRSESEINNVVDEICGMDNFNAFIGIG